MAKVIGCDLDGTLCKGDAYTLKECLLAEPRWDKISLLNELSKTAFVVILTARRDELIPNTLKWLRAHNVTYHALSNNKMPADWYYDDKATNVEDWREPDPYP